MLACLRQMAARGFARLLMLWMQQIVARPLHRRTAHQGLPLPEMSSVGLLATGQWCRKKISLGRVLHELPAWDHYVLRTLPL